MLCGTPRAGLPSSSRLRRIGQQRVDVAPVGQQAPPLGQLADDVQLDALAPLAADLRNGEERGVEQIDGDVLLGDVEAGGGDGQPVERLGLDAAFPDLAQLGLQAGRVSSRGPPPGGSNESLYIA